MSDCQNVENNIFSGGLTSAPNGTISLSLTTSSVSTTCFVPIVANYPNTKVVVTCNSKSTGTTFNVLTSTEKLKLTSVEELLLYFSCISFYFSCSPIYRNMRAGHPQSLLVIAALWEQHTLLFTTMCFSRQVQQLLHLSQFNVLGNRPRKTCTIPLVVCIQLT